MKKIKGHLDYFNLISKNEIISFAGITIFFIVMSMLNISDNLMVNFLRLTISIILILITVYLYLSYNEFSYSHGKVMGRINQFIISKLIWKGEGKLLDIGCGSGSLSILLAKKYKKAKIIGIDLWNNKIKNGKEKCEKNAKIEEVTNVEFVRADASNLPYEDETFDSVVSNFTFSKMKKNKDKKALIKEALRVVKKDGKFAFHDIFENQKVFGDIEEIVDELKEEGISEVHYIPNIEQCNFIPKILRTPIMLKDLGILYGKK